jgi:hypothetical protein
LPGCTVRGNVFVAEDTVQRLRISKGLTCSEKSDKFRALGLECLPWQSSMDLIYISRRWPQWLAYTYGNKTL